MQQVQPLSHDVMANLSIEELEDRLELQILQITEAQFCYDCGQNCGCNGTNCTCNAQCTTDICGAECIGLCGAECTQLCGGECFQLCGAELCITEVFTPD